MIGYIYDKDTRKIATRVDNVTACNDTTIKGDGIAVLGTGAYVISDLEFNENDILPSDIIDKRSDIQKLITQ